MPTQLNKKLFFILLLITLIYSKTLQGFFQQDEWLSFIIHSPRNNFTESISRYFSPNLSHYNPLTELSFHLALKVFGMSYVKLIWISILGHLVVVYLVYLISYKLLRNQYLSIYTAALFGLSASIHQAVSWISAGINTIGATIFGLLSVLAFFKYLSGSSSKFNLWSIFAYLLISLLFKEIAIGLLILFPIYAFINKNYFKEIIKSTIIFGTSYVAFRGVSVFTQSVSEAQPVVTDSQSLVEILTNIATFPIKIFGQTVLPTRLLINMSYALSALLPESISGSSGTTRFAQFSENITLQLIYFAIFSTVMFLIYKSWNTRKETHIKNAIIFGLVFVFFNSLVYALSPGRGGIIPTVDSRNLYFPAIGTYILLVTLLSNIYKTKIVKISCILIPLIILNIYWLNKDLVQLTNIGRVRRQIFDQIKADYPDLPNKVVFYTKSDKPYYGMAPEDKIMPFQTNFGYTLAVWYNKTENYPKEIVGRERFLKKLTDEGYKEINGVGYGYFRDISELKLAVNKYNLNKESVIAYDFSSDGNVLTDISDEVISEIFDISSSEVQ